MKKLIIIISGGSRMHAPPKIGEFVKIQGFEELIWKGRLLDIEEFNEVASKLFANQKNLHIPASYYLAVKVVDDNQEEDLSDYLGEDLLPELQLEENETKQDVLRAICKEVYNGCVKDWNNLGDYHMRNLIMKAFNMPLSQEEMEDDLNEAEKEILGAENLTGDDTVDFDETGEDEPEGEEPTETTETTESDENTGNETSESDGLPASYKHKGRGKYDVYDKDGNVLLDNVTKAEAKALVPDVDQPEEEQ